MPSYEVRQCEGSGHEKWCIYVNGVCDRSLGEFDTRAEAETKVCQLILRDKVLTMDSSAKFSPLSSQNHQYTGPILATVDSSEGFGYGAAQSLGRGTYALHTGKAFVAVKPSATITIKYRGEEIKVEPPKPRERNENER